MVNLRADDQRMTRVNCRADDYQPAGLGGSTVVDQQTRVEHRPRHRFPVGRANDSVSERAGTTSGRTGKYVFTRGKLSLVFGCGTCAPFFPQPSGQRARAVRSPVINFPSARLLLLVNYINSLGLLRILGKQYRAPFTPF